MRQKFQSRNHFRAVYTAFQSKELNAFVYNEITSILLVGEILLLL